MMYILGAGSLGCLWAAHLQHSLPDQRIAFVSTKHTKPGLVHFSLDTAFDNRPTTEHRFKVIPHRDITNIDTLLLCTKSYDAPKAIETLKPLLHAESNVILFQNGLGAHFKILDIIKEQTALFAAVTTEGANRPTVNQLVHAGRGSTYLGALNEVAKDDERLSRLTEQLRSTQLALNIEHDIWPRLWNKLVINCAINPFTALLNCANGEVNASSLFKTYWPKLKLELATMLAEAGYAKAPEEIDNLVLEVMKNTAQNISSMLQDVRNGRTTEIDDINGFAYRYLLEKNHSASTNQMLSDKVKEFTPHASGN